jgi:hypothetical protein
MQTQSESSVSASLPRFRSPIASQRAGRRWLPLSRLLAGVACALLASAAAIAQSDYFTNLDQTNGEFQDLAVAPNGTLVAVGTKYFNDVETGVVRVRANPGESWVERVPDPAVNRYLSAMTGRREIAPATLTEPATFEDSIVIAAQAGGKSCGASILDSIGS